MAALGILSRLLVAGQRQHRHLAARRTDRLPVCFFLVKQGREELVFGRSRRGSVRSVSHAPGAGEVQMELQTGRESTNRCSAKTGLTHTRVDRAERLLNGG